MNKKRKKTGKVFLCLAMVFFVLTVGTAIVGATTYRGGLGDIATDSNADMASTNPQM